MPPRLWTFWSDGCWFRAKTPGTGSWGSIEPWLADGILSVEPRAMGEQTNFVDSSSGCIVILFSADSISALGLTSRTSDEACVSGVVGALSVFGDPVDQLLEFRPLFRPGPVVVPVAVVAVRCLPRNPIEHGSDKRGMDPTEYLHRPSDLSAG